MKSTSFDYIIQRVVRSHCFIWLNVIAGFFSCVGSSIAAAPDRFEYSSGEETLPFAYSVSVSKAPRPHNLDFTENRYPDNCQALVRIDGELWQFQSRFGISLTGHGPFPPHARYAGPDIDHMTRREDSTFPAGYHLAWILGGLWYDEVAKKLYAPMHIESEGIDRDGPVAPWASRKVILATSTDKGQTWHDEGDIITPETFFSISDVYKFSGSDYSNGLCDFGFYADVREGYFYLYPTEAWLTKGTWYCRFSTRVARCAISDKMAPGRWKFYYNGEWDQSALGGKSSVVAPIIWPIIYNTYLHKYLCFFPSNGFPLTEDNVDGVYMGYCTDLSKQDWKWARFPEAKLIFMNVLNADGTDFSSCGKSLRFYDYGLTGNTFQRLDITFMEGKTVGPSVRPRYSFEGHPESSDRIIGRRTKFIGSANAETIYTGTWIDRTAPSSYENRLKENASGGSVALSFVGSDVYWRAACSPDSGLADVYIDGSFKRTVDCFSPQSTDYEQIVYILTGLSPKVTHTIKVVVRDVKNPFARGITIRHIGFEYAAESYKASAGFSSLMGNNNWYYQQWSKASCDDMHFMESTGVFRNYWTGTDNCRLGPDYQTPDAGAVVREWKAPHGGSVRIEGCTAVDQTLDSGARVEVLKNKMVLWPARIIQPGHSEKHDVTVGVEQNDSICFVASNGSIASGNAASERTNVKWDPTITYVGDSAPAVWKANLPGNENLASGKYARSKRLWHGYTPSFAVDGSVDTGFTISDYDEISSGDDWLMLDLNRSYQIDRYVVLSVPPNPLWRPKNFVLQASDDGASWKDIDRVTNNLHDRVERMVPLFKARYIRLYLPDGKPLSINEFELYYTAGKQVSDESTNLGLR